VKEQRPDRDEPSPAIPPLLPGPEPEVVAPSGTGPERPRIIPVCETLLDGNELAYLTECIRSNWISSQGPFVARFEESFARSVGCRFGVACSSGTAALHLSLAALDLKADDEVILPTFTMIATANAVAYTGARPVLVDADTETWNLDLSRIEEKITPATRALVIVHTYGRPVAMDAVHEIARRHGLFVIEDAAEAHGARDHGRPVGSLGDVAAFSFYGNKIITTGEGGMLTTNDEGLAERARRLRELAFSDERHFWHSALAFNYRMTNLQAAVGLAQTERFESLVEARRRNARFYTERLEGVSGLTLPREAPDTRNVFWMFGLLVEEQFGLTRDELRSALARAGIETRTFFIPIHLQPVYEHLFRKEKFPVAEALCRKGMYLPSGPNLKLQDIDRVARNIIEAARRPSAPAQTQERHPSEVATTPLSGSPSPR
jgi:perosamine synthetase